LGGLDFCFGGLKPHQAHAWLRPCPPKKQILVYATECFLDNLFLNQNKIKLIFFPTVGLYTYIYRGNGGWGGGVHEALPKIKKLMQKLTSLKK